MPEYLRPFPSFRHHINHINVIQHNYHVSHNVGTPSERYTNKCNVSLRLLYIKEIDTRFRKPSTLSTPKFVNVRGYETHLTSNKQCHLNVISVNENESPGYLDRNKNVYIMSRVRNPLEITCLQSSLSPIIKIIISLRQ